MMRPESKELIEALKQMAARVGCEFVPDKAMTERGVMSERTIPERLRADCLAELGWPSDLKPEKLPPDNEVRRQIEGDCRWQAAAHIDALEALLAAKITDFESKATARVFEETRERRQQRIYEWCAAAFGQDHATSIEQRGLRLAEEAIEAAQAAGCNPETMHKMIDYVYSRPAGALQQELGGVGLCALAMAASAGFSADEAEQAECQRVMAKPLAFFAERNRVKNNAGFVADAWKQPSALPSPTGTEESVERSLSGERGTQND